MSAPSAPLDLEPARLAFVEESRELLRGLEEGLLNLGEQPDDPEALIAVFRAAHTIKGSSGIFGYDGIVAFTHVLEELLESARSGEVRIDHSLIALLLACGDHLFHLIDCVSTGAEPDAARRAQGEALAEQLRSATPGVPATLGSEPDLGTVEAIGPHSVERDTWHISARFGPEVLREGMDPLSILGYLATLGRIASIYTLCDALPPLEDLDPEACYLGVEIEFAAPGVDKATIEGAFEFLGESCAVRILPPDSKVGDYLRLIEESAGDKSLLGQILVDSGALTVRELREGLAQQAQSQQPSAAAGPGEEGPRLGEILMKQGAVASEVLDAALRKQRDAQQGRRPEGAMRVRADKLDELIDLVGELVIAVAGASNVAHREHSPAMLETTAGMGRLVEQIRDGALRLRMVPIGELFGRFRRLVHDLGASLGKDVELRITGAETELDKSMIEGLGDPLVHLVRNALDHGIEPVTEREGGGKPARATVYLNAYHDSGSIVVEVADDGRGLDRERIFSKAVARGLVPAGEALADEQVYALIMRPGFSTAEEVTNLSGRGIGMDVVQRNVEALRGSVAIESVPGHGTKFTLRLPLTLAIIDGFLFNVGASGYVVPLDAVVECVELPESERAAVDASGFVNLRGQRLPVLRLRTMFEVEAGASRRENVLVVQHGGQRIGLVVDALLGEFQTVIKPLGKLFASLRGVSGSTILGSGEVALILDVPELIGRAIAREGEQANLAASGRWTRRAAPAARLPAAASLTTLSGE